MALNVRAAFLLCFFVTAASIQSIQMKDTEDKEQTAHDGILRVSRTPDDGLAAPERISQNVKRQEDAERAIVEQQAKAKEQYLAKRRSRALAEEAKTKNATADALETASRHSHVTSAKGDPHLVNMLGQRFDINRPGQHLLIQVPKLARSEKALLRVQGTVERCGGSCSDMYFTSLNVTGKWARKAKGYHFSVRNLIAKDEMKWTKFGPLSLKIVHGHTHGGIQYLNLFVKNLGKVPFRVGGLMGEDDHTHVATPVADCRRMIDI